MARSKNSKKWLTEHFDDPYVKKAQKLGLRSRSAFKLMEMEESTGLSNPVSASWTSGAPLVAGARSSWRVWVKKAE